MTKILLSMLATTLNLVDSTCSQNCSKHCNTASQGGRGGDASRVVDHARDVVLGPQVRGVRARQLEEVRKDSKADCFPGVGGQVG